MNFDIEITGFSQWSNYNEHEGEINFSFANLELCAYTILNPIEWRALRCGSRVRGNVLLERSGQPLYKQILADKKIHQTSGCFYIISGLAEKWEDELLIMDCGIKLHIDFDVQGFNEPKEKLCGRYIMTQGKLCLELTDKIGKISEFT